MTQLTQQDIAHIAHLARIGVSEKDIAHYQEDLSQVLEYFAQLEELDTTDVAPIGHITGMTNVLRTDRAQPTDDDTKAHIMDAVPQTQDGYIKVKSVF